MIPHRRTLPSVPGPTYCPKCNHRGRKWPAGCLVPGGTNANGAARSGKAHAKHADAAIYRGTGQHPAAGRIGRVNAPDRDLTEVIPRHASGTGPIPAIPPSPPAGGCPVLRRPAAWRHALTAALILFWITLAMWAYALIRAGLLLWEWR